MSVFVSALVSAFVRTPLPILAAGGRTMPIKCLPIVLPPSIYARLEREAQAAERGPLQQARWILKQALGGAAVAPPTDDRLTTGSPATTEVR